MIKITFPDGSVREYEKGVTGLQIAESISPALARNVVSCGVNGETTELNRPINEDATIALYKFEDEEGKHTFWHTSAHLLAEALQELYPGIQFGFGPAVENGFFYDVMPPEGVTIKESDFPAIEAAKCLKPMPSRSSRLTVRTTSASTSTKTSRTAPSQHTHRAPSQTSVAVRTLCQQATSRLSRLQAWQEHSGAVTLNASR